MTMNLELTPEVQASLMSQAQANGMSLEAFAEQVLREKSRAAELHESTESSAAARRLASFGKRHNLSLGDMSIQELLRESRP